MGFWARVQRYFRSWNRRSRPQPIRQRVATRLRPQGLEPRIVLNADFDLTATSLNLTDQGTANQDIAISADATSFFFTLTGGQWVGTDGGGVVGNGTNVLTVDKAVFAGLSSGLSLNNGANATNDVSFTGATTIDFGSSISIVTGGNVTGAGANVTVAGAASFSGSTITLATGGETLTATGAATFTATAGGISVGGAGTTDFASLTFNATGAVTIQEDSATSLAGVNTASSLSLTSAGAITDASTSLAVTNNASFNGTSVTVGSAGITTNFGSLTFNSAGAVSIQEDSATALAGANTASSLSLTSTAGITDGSTSLTVTNNASFAGSSIAIGGGGTTTNLGSFTFNSAGGVVLAEDSATVLAGDNTAQNLAISSSGGISDSSTSLAVTTNAAFASSSITIGGAGTTTNFGSVTFSSAGAVSIQEDSDTSLLGANVANSLSLTSTGAITDGSASLAVTNNASFGGTSIAIGGASTTNFGSVTVNSGGTVSIQEDSATAIAGSAGSLTVSSTGAITQTAALAVTGTSSFTATTGGTSITLTDSANDFGGAVSLFATGAGNVAITDVNALVLGASTLGTGTFTVDAVGISQTGAIAQAPAAGAVTFNAGAGAISLIDAGNNFTGAVSLNNSGANNVAITDVNALLLGASTVGTGTLTVNAVGITQSGAIIQGAAAGAATFNAGAGVITLTNTSNDFTGSVSLNNSGASNVSIRDANAIILGASAVGTETLTITAVGITQTGGITQAGAGAVTLAGAGGIIDLSDPGNDFVGTVAATGTAVSLRDDANGMVLGNITASAGLTVGSDDAITQAATTTISGVGLTKQGPGTLTLSEANNYSGTTTVSAGTLLVTNATSGTGTSNVQVNAGVLGGTGRITGSVTVASGATVAPGLAAGTTGILRTGSITFQTGSFYVADVNTNTAGTGYDQINVTGTVTIQSGVTLTTNGTITSNPGNNNINLIVNDGNDNITGTFAGLPDEGTRSINGVAFVADYDAGGGGGNDFRLTQSGTFTFTSDGVGAGNLELRRIGNNVQFLDDGVIVESRSIASLLNQTVTVVGANGQSETLLVNYGASGGFFDVDINWNGGETAGDNDKLDINGGTFTTVTHTFLTTTPANAGNIVYNTASASATINYTGLEPVDMAGSTITTLIFNLPDAADTVFLEDDGTAANGISQIRSGTSAFETTTFDNSVGTLIVNMGLTATVDLTVDIPDYTRSLTINGLGGTDTVVFSGTTNLSAAGSDLSVTVGGTITGAGTVAANDAMTLVASSIDLTGAVSGATLDARSLNDTGGLVRLSNAANDFSTVSLRARNAADTLNAAGAITYADADGFDVATALTTSTVTLVGGGPITDSGQLTGTTLFAKTLNNGGAAITLDNATNEFTTVNLQARDAADAANAAGAITYRDATGFDVQTALTTSSVTLTGGDAITDSGQLTGTSLIVKTLNNAGAAIALDNQTNDFATVNLQARNAADAANAAGAITYFDATGFDVAAALTTSTVTLSGTGTITDSGQLTGTLLTARTFNNAGADIVLDNATNDFASIRLESFNALGNSFAAGNLTYRDATGFDIVRTITTTGNVTLTAGGAITGSTSLMNGNTLTVKTLNDAGAAITLDSATINFNTVNLQARNAADATNAAGAITYVDQTGFDVATIRTASTVTLSGTDAITDSGQLVGTTLSVKTLNDAGAAITLDFATNDFDTINLQARNAADTANASGVINYTDSDSVAVDIVSTTATVCLEITGAITDANAGALNVTASALELRTGGGVGTAADRLEISVGTVAARATTSGGIFLEQVAAAGSLTVGTVGAVSGLNASGANGDISVLVNAGNLVISDAIASGNGTIRLRASGDITQTAAITGATLAAVSDTGDIDLSLATNNVTDFAAAATGGGQFVSFRDTNSVNLSTVTAGNVFVADVSGVNVGTSAGSTVRLRATTNITQDATAPVIADLLGAEAGNLVELCLAPNDVNTFAATAGSAVRFMDANTFTLGTVTAGSVLSADLNGVTAPNEIDLRAGGNLQLNQALTSTTVRLQSDTGSVTQDAGAIITGTSLLARAGTDVDLRLANDVDVFSAETTDGFVYFNDTDGLTISFVNGSSCIGGASGVTAGGTGNNVEILAGGNISLLQDIAAADDTVRLQTTAGSIVQTGGGVSAANFSARATAEIDLRSASNSVDVVAAVTGANAADFLYYRDSGSVTVGTVAGGTLVTQQVVGVEAGQDIEIRTSGELGLEAAVTAIGDDVRLQADDGSITQTSAGTIFATNLSAQANGVFQSVELCTAANDVGTFAGSAAVAVRFMDANTFALGTVGAGVLVASSVTGVTAPTEIDLRAGVGNLNISEALTSTTIRLQADNGSLTQSGTGTITATNLLLLASNNINFQLANDAGTLAAEATAGFVYFRDTSGLTVGTVAGSVCIAGDAGVVAGGDIEILTVGTLGLQAEVTAAGDTVRLQSTTGSITQTVAGVITAASLSAQANAAGQSVELCTANNDVDTFAASAAVAVRFMDVDNFALGTVPGGVLIVNNVTGITAASEIDLRAGSGDLAITEALSSGTIRLQADNGSVTQSGTGTITAGSLLARASGNVDLRLANDVNIFAAETTSSGFVYFRDTDDLVVGSVAASICITTGATGVVASGAGDIEILTGGTLDLQAVVTADGDDVRLQATAGSITQTVAGVITAANLSARADAGSVELCVAANDVDTLAARAATAVRFMDADTFTLGTVTGGVLVTTSLTGITGSGGNLQEIDLRAGSGNLDVNLALTATIAVRLQADNGAITQSGTGTIVATSLVARASGNIELLLGNDANTFAAATTTSAGSIYFNDVDDLVIGTVAGSICVTGATGVVAGDATAEAGAAGDIEIRTAAILSIQAVVTAQLDDIRLVSTGSVITQTATGVITGGRLSAQAFNNVTLCIAVNNVDEFAATSTVGSVYFRDFDGVTVGSLAGGVLVTNLVTGITAGVDVEIMAGEEIIVDQAITAIGDDVRLEVTGGSISQSATGIITTANLSAQASADVNLGTAANDVNVFAATATTGDVFFRDSDDLIVGSVAGGFCVVGAVNGITAGTDIEVLTVNDLSLQQAVTAAGDDVRLQSTAGSVTQTAAGVITAANLSAQAAADVNLCVAAANDVDVFAATATSGFVLFRDADDLIVGSVTGGTLVTTAVNGITGGTDVEVMSVGALSLQQAVTALGDDVRLQSTTGAVTQSGAGAIAAGSLSAQAATNVDLRLANDVDTFAAVTGNGFVYFRDADDLIVGNVTAGTCVTTAVNGITANGASDVELLTAGNLSLQQVVNALGDDVRLQSTAGSISQTATGAIAAANLSAQANGAGQSVELCLANNDVDVFAASAGSAVRFMDADTFTLGNVAGGVLVTGAVNGVTAPSEIDLRSVGSLSINLALSSGTVRLQSDTGSVTQSAAIGAGSLLARAAGSVDLSTLVNDVAIFSAEATTGNVYFQDANDVTVGAVAGSICIGGGTGIVAGLDVEILAGLNIGVNEAITALGDDVRLQAVGGSIVQSATGIITSSTLSAFAAGSVDLALANNDVDFFTAAATAGNVYFLDADDLRIVAIPGGALVTTAGSGVTAALDIELLAGGNLSLETAITAASDIRLVSTAGAITQTAGGILTTANLSAAAGTLISLGSANNDVDVFAATTGTGDVAYFDVDSVAIGTVAAGARVPNAIDGITAAGGTANVTLTAGAVTDGNGTNVNVTANVLSVTTVTGLGTSADFFDTSVTSLFANIIGTGGVFVFETDAIILENVVTANGSIAVVTNDLDRVTLDVIAGTNTPATNLGAGGAASSTITVRTVTAGDATPLDANASTALLVAKGSGGDIVFQGTAVSPLGVGGALMVFNTAAASATLVAGGNFVFTSGQSTIMTVNPVTSLAYAIAKNFDRAGYYTTAGGQVPIGNNGDVSITLDTVGVAGELGLNVHVDWGDLDGTNFLGFLDTSPRYTGVSFGGTGWTADANATYLTGGNPTILSHTYSQADQFALSVPGTLPGGSPNLFFVDFAVSHDPSIVVLASSVNGQALSPINTATGETLGLASSTDIPAQFRNLEQYSPGSVNAADVRQGTGLNGADALDNGRVEILLSSVVTFITLPVQTESEVVLERAFPLQVSEFVSVSLPTTPVEPIRQTPQRSASRELTFELVIIADDPNAEPEVVTLPKDILDGNNLELLLKNLPDGSYELRYRMGETGNPRSVFRFDVIDKAVRSPDVDLENLPTELQLKEIRSTIEKSVDDTTLEDEAAGAMDDVSFDASIPNGNESDQSGGTAQSAAGADSRRSPAVADPDRASLATEIEHTLSDGPAVATDAAPRAALAGVPLLLAAWKGGRKAAENPFSRSARRRRRANS